MIANVVTTTTGFQDVRNPLPAQGGTDPEPIEQAQLYAPQAFRTQERAVTEADYAMVTERHPEVMKAEATLRWTGSWHTMFVTVDREGGQPVDADFRAQIRNFDEQFRLAGYDLEVEAPIFVPLDIAFTVCVAPGYFRSNVKARLLDVFSNRDLPDGRRGFFHPDNFTFGQPVYLSQIVATAMQVAGVLWVDTDDIPPKPNHFRRWGQASHGETQAGFIKLDRVEIARLDNDPNEPENGKIDFYMEGGI
jgi:predicted phage baseplate assembly protein